MSEPVEQIRFTTSQTVLGHWKSQVWSDDELIAESHPSDLATVQEVNSDLAFQLTTKTCDHCGHYIETVVSVEYDDGRLTIFGSCGNEE